MPPLPVDVEAANDEDESVLETTTFCISIIPRSRHLLDTKRIGGVMNSDGLIVPNKSELVINSSLHVQFEKPMPCRWWRFWQWVFFGFEWKGINDA